jgi:hypothetical protein
VSAPRERPGRAEPREVLELRRIKERQPELAAAADLQIGLLLLQRRVQSRVPLPSLKFEAGEHLRQRPGRPLLDFEDIPLDWTDFRLMFRETASLMHRYDAIEAPEYRRAEALGREANALPPLVIGWYNRTAAAPGGPADADPLDPVILLAMRPFLARCAEAVLPRLDLSRWQHPICPMCGGEPDFAVITPAAERLLICSRCTGRWPFEPLTCPYCGNTDRGRITSFASRDGLYRIFACDACQRYLKAYDARRADRPVMPPVDSVATLPLDAAAIQKGYSG